MKKILFFIFFLCLTYSSTSLAQKTLSITTTIAPVAYLIEAIGKEKISVSVMIPANGNPHTYEPIPSQLKQLSVTDLYVEVGSGIEFELSWMTKLIALNKTMRICNASENIKLIPMGEDLEDEKDEGEDEHHHTGNDPHIWTSPKNAVIMAKNILKNLIEIDPLNKEFYTKNANNLISELNDLAEKIESKLSTLTNRTILVFHPAWGYFAYDFDLTQKSVENYGKEPTPQQLTNLIKEAKKDNIKIIFASPQFSQKSANVIAREIGGAVSLIDPLSKDYIDNLKKVADSFAKNIR